MNHPLGEEVRVRVWEVTWSIGRGRIPGENDDLIVDKNPSKHNREATELEDRGAALLPALSVTTTGGPEKNQFYAPNKDSPRGIDEGPMKCG